VENVKDRLRRTTAALNAAGVPYAVVGDSAAQHWVAQVDESVVRNTRDVDIIPNRADLPRAIAALEAARFLHRHAASVDMFLDGPAPKPATPFMSSLPARRSGRNIPNRSQASASMRSLMTPGRSRSMRSSG
jgi:hypothetical protein